MGPAPRASARLFQFGMLLFIITIVIGILNGTDVVEFDHNTILTHVHAGTLGWLTLSIVGSALWLFGFGDGAEADRLAVVSGASVVLYVAAFWIGNDVLRPIGGTIMFVAVLWVVVAVTRRSQGAAANVPRLAVLLALYSLLAGAVLGILLGLSVTGRADWVPSGVAEAHPPTMVVGYLVLAAMGLAEWLLTQQQPARGSTRLGQIQVALVFLAGVVLVLGLIFEVEPLIIANAPLEVAGIIIFIRRLWKPFRAVSLSTPSAQRWMLASALLLVLNIVYIVFLVGKSGGDFDTIRFDLILALDHIMFVGVLTTALFGIIAAATGALSRDDNGVFFGLLVGLTLFVVGLMGDWTMLKRIGTPVLGAALLYGIVVNSRRLGALRPAGASHG